MNESGEEGPSHRDLVHPTKRERWEKADATLEPLKALVHETDEMREIRSKAAEVLRQPIAEARALLYQYAAQARGTIESYQGEEAKRAWIGYDLLIAEMWLAGGVSSAAIKEMWDAKSHAQQEGMKDVVTAIDDKVVEIEFLDDLAIASERKGSS